MSKETFNEVLAFQCAKLNIQPGNYVLLAKYVYGPRPEILDSKRLAIKLLSDK